MGIEEKHMYIKERKNYLPALKATIDKESLRRLFDIRVQQFLSDKSERSSTSDLS
jgi:hypothetical protein